MGVHFDPFMVVHLWGRAPRILLSVRSRRRRTRDSRNCFTAVTVVSEDAFVLFSIIGLQARRGGQSSSSRAFIFSAALIKVRGAPHYTGRARHSCELPRGLCVPLPKFHCSFGPRPKGCSLTQIFSRLTWRRSSRWASTRRPLCRCSLPSRTSTTRSSAAQTAPTRALPAPARECAYKGHYAVCVGARRYATRGSE